MASQNKGQSGPSFSAEGLFIHFGHLLGPLVEKAGINTDVLTNPNVQVPLDKHCRLMELAAQYHRDDFLGLRIGSQVEPRDMGPLGYTILNSPTVLDALKSFVRYLRVYARGCEMALDVNHDVAEFIYTYSITEPCALERRQEAECTIAMVKHTLELLTSKKFELDAVGFEHPAPQNTSRHQSLFDAPIYFSQNVNSIRFKADLLDREIVNADARLFEVLESHLEKVLESFVEEEDLVARVGSAVARSLSSGVPNIGDIAASLFMTKRTLQRRLAEEGVLYNEFADEIRRKLAVRYIENTNMPLTEVAFLLGYSHISAFSRAFRRWTGRSPNSFRSPRTN
jgi:AraC-like DNA-binding protein